MKTLVNNRRSWIRYRSIVALPFGITLVLLAPHDMKGQNPQPRGSITINGTDYIPFGPAETVTASFLIPDGGVTSNMYSGFVEVKVSGSGESVWTELNDAFYVYTDTAHNPMPPSNSDPYWQLSIDSAPLVGSTQPHGARNCIVFDVDAGHQVTPPYICSYRPDHVYDVVISTARLSAGGAARTLHFGVCDQVYSDNSGSYTIAIQQLAVAIPVIPTILAPPQSQTAEVDSTVRFSARATGYPPPAYAWLCSGQLLGGCTSSALSLANVQFSHSGAYAVVATNSSGAITSSPAMLSVIAPVLRTLASAILLRAEAGSTLHLDHSDGFGLDANWMALNSVDMASPSQIYVDVPAPRPAQRFYRAWQTNVPAVKPSLELSLTTRLTLTGAIGLNVRIDYINRFGPTDAWVTLDTVTFTNTTQPWFDFSMFGQPVRLYRLVPLP